MAKLTKEQIIKNNELIAEFMGATKFDYLQYDEGWTEFRFKEHPDCTIKKRWERFSPSRLQYDVNWNWLMPVVERIEQLQGVEIVICTEYCFISYGDTEDLLINKDYNTDKVRPEDCCSSKFEGVYMMCVQFLEYYNTLKDKL